MMTAEVGRGGSTWPDVRRIVVLRGGGLGDLLFAVPALHALAAAYPAAEIVLLGTPMHAELLEGRPGPVTGVLALPPVRGVFEPPGVPLDDGALAVFVRKVCREPVDLGVQLHGGGAWSNPLLGRFAPRWTVGCRTADAAPLTRSLPYRYYQHEVLRMLEVAGLAGAPPVILEPRLAVTDADLVAAERVLSDLPEPVVAVHPGATDPRRRWPPDRFAEIVARCAERGCDVVVLGSPDERDLLDAVTTQAMRLLPARRHDAVRAMPWLDMPALCGVLATSRLLVGNDSGPRHLAQAVGTPTVGVFWMGNVINAGPLSRGQDRILVSWTGSCPVCGRDCTREDLPRCGHDTSFVSSVQTAAVWAEVADLLD